MIIDPTEVQTKYKKAHGKKVGISTLLTNILSYISARAVFKRKNLSKKRASVVYSRLYTQYFCRSCAALTVETFGLMLH